MSRRFWFISCSIAAHVGLGFGVFASGIWSVDRLDRDDPRSSALAVFIPDTAAPSGGGMELKTQELHPKPRIEVKGPTQPPQKKIEDTKPGGTETGTGDKTGPGTGTADPTSTGTCLIEPCGEVKKVEPDPVKPVEKPVIAEKTIRSDELSLMRLTGNTQLHPDDVTKNAMIRDGKPATSGIVKVCVSETGAIATVKLLKSTKYPAYDQLLVRGVRGWTYKPYTSSGHLLKVCGTVTFQYAIN
ncbi:MAG: energy transducer TonB [Kofleriaceae bacterium]